MTIKSYEEWLQTIDVESENMSADKDELYKVVKEGYETFDGVNSAEILWRMSRAAYKVAAAAELVKDTDKQKKFLTEAVEWGKKALDKDANCGRAHLWLANIYGKICDHLGSKEKIAKGKEIQQHLEACIQSLSDDFLPYYTYGRWCMEVAKLTWLERKVAATLFAKPPEASWQDAIDKFTRVDELRPGWRANSYYIARCQVNQKNYKEAIKALDTGLTYESVDEEDKLINDDMAALQKKYASYR